LLSQYRERHHMNVVFTASVRGRARLQHLGGQISLSGTHAPVSIERDANGVPTLRAANRRDLAKATGYVH
jgi:penicillin amidase